MRRRLALRIPGEWICTTGAGEHLRCVDFAERLSCCAVVLIQTQKTFQFKLNPSLQFGQKIKPKIETKNIRALTTPKNDVKLLTVFRSLNKCLVLRNSGRCGWPLGWN